MGIAVILGVLFIALAGAGLAVGIISIAKKKRRVSGSICCAVGGVCALLFFVVPFSFHTVDAGEVAVVKHLGEARKVRTSGTYFDFWLTETYERYDAKVQDLSIFTQAYSNDAQTMDIEMTVQYQIDTSKVISIANTYGSLELLNSRITSVGIDAMKTVMAESTAEEIIEGRGSISQAVTECIISRIDSSYYVSVQTAVLTDIGFTDAYEAAVEAQMIAEREKARGEADAQKALAEAEAYSASVKIVELARSFGYEVTEIAGEDGSVSFEVLWEDDAGKQLIVEYLQYLEYLAKWNGELPDVVGDGTGIMITVPSSPDGQP